MIASRNIGDTSDRRNRYESEAKLGGAGWVRGKTISPCHGLPVRDFN
jgi:hypothetical protein